MKSSFFLLSISRLELKAANLTTALMKLSRQPVLRPLRGQKRILPCLKRKFLCKVLLNLSCLFYLTKLYFYPTTIRSVSCAVAATKFITNNNSNFLPFHLYCRQFTYCYNISQIWRHTYTHTILLLLLYHYCSYTTIVNLK